MRALLPLVALSGAASAGTMTGKVVVVTGSTGGIGASLAKLAAEQGASVVVTGRRRDKCDATVASIKEKGGDAACFVADIAEPAGVSGLMEFAEQTYGGIDSIVVNAGITPQDMTLPLPKQPDHDIKKQVDVNLLSPLLCVKYGVPAMQKRGGGKLVLISSIISLMNAKSCEPGGLLADQFIPYAATKSGVDMIRRTLSAYPNIDSWSLNLGAYASEISDRLVGQFGCPDRQCHSAFNTYFNDWTPHTDVCARSILPFLDGSTMWPAGTNVVVEGDATMDAKILLERMEDPWPTKNGWPRPEELQPHLRDHRGGPYVDTRASDEL